MNDLGFPAIPGTEPAYNVNNLQFDTDPDTMRQQYYAQTLAAQQTQQNAPTPAQYAASAAFAPSQASETPGTAVVAPAAPAETGFYGDVYDEGDYSDAGAPGEYLEFYDGVQQSSILLGFALIGQTADQWLKERTGTAGYGPLLGAAAGNAVNSVVSAGNGGMKAGAKALGGALLPVVPLAIAVGLKREISGGTRIALLLSSAGLLAASLYMKRGKK
jgi:hypothetical protein